eukprot:TRINITY_DN663_c0_g1_i2.p1 TRINITY_DN663_c0_g1~~TRINITY_DN663_c0_g1_i2.p1  ORF type:complete len:313 (+),score=48.07 TRINITY_DN663_c0_g1_i2:112-939(+)
MDEDSLKEPDSPSSFDEKLCCDECLRENRPNGRSCICRVPKNQRRGNLGGVGCITCGCPGCHSEDADTKLEKSELDTDQPNENAESTTRSDDRSEAPLKNGCCKPCMKAFSDNSKACICQVPSYVRKAVLPPAGCSVCKCKGCHPNDIIARKRKYSGDHSDSRSQRRSSPFHRGKCAPSLLHLFSSSLLLTSSTKSLTSSIRFLIPHFITSSSNKNTQNFSQNYHLHSSNNKKKKNQNETQQSLLNLANHSKTFPSSPSKTHHHIIFFEDIFFVI